MNRPHFYQNLTTITYSKCLRDRCHTRKVIQMHLSLILLAKLTPRISLTRWSKECFHQKVLSQMRATTLWNVLLELNSIVSEHEWEEEATRTLRAKTTHRRFLHNHRGVCWTSLSIWFRTQSQVQWELPSTLARYLHLKTLKHLLKSVPRTRWSVLAQTVFQRQ